MIVLTDEAHRSQYDTLALNMRAALPKALFLAAQTRDEMRGKTPDELASMMREKPTVINIILSTAPMGEDMEEEGTEEEMPAGENVKTKMDAMKKSAKASDMEEEDMADEEMAKSYKSKMMM